MKKLAGYGLDDHPAGDEDKAQLAWAVALLDDCDACQEPRIELTVEEAGLPGAGLAAHLSPQTARRLRALLAVALKEIGERPDE